MPLRVSPIYDGGLYKHNKPTSTTSKKNDDSDSRLHPSLKALAIGGKLTFKASDKVCVERGSIGALYGDFAQRVTRANYALKRDAFFIVAKRGEQDKQNAHVVKYSSRKIKKVTNLGGVIEFSIWRCS